MPFIPDRQPAKSGFIPDRKSVGGFAGNVANSGARFVGDTAGALINTFNPDMEKNTLANMVRLGASIVSVALPGEQGNEDLARSVGQYYVDRYGGLDNAWNSFYNDPVGVAADVSTVLTGAGAAVKGVGTVSKMSNVAKVGNTISNVGRAVDPINATSRLLSKVPAKKLFQKVGTKLENAGNELPTKGLGNPAKQADLAARSGKTVGQFIDEYNLWDRSPESAGAAKNAIFGQYDDLASNSGKTTAVNKIVGAIDQQIEQLMSGTGKYSDSVQAQVAELARRKSQILEIAGNRPSIGLNEIVDYRRALDKDIPRSMFNLDTRGSGTAQGAKATRDVLKGTIDASDPRLAGLGKDYGMAKGVEDIFRKSQSRARNRQLLNFGGVTKAGVGGIIAGVPGVIAGYATDAITNDPRFLKVASKTLKATGKAVKEAKLPSVPEYANTAYKVAKVGRMVNLPNSTNQPGRSQAKQGGSSPSPVPKPQTDSTLKSSSSVPLDTASAKVRSKSKGIKIGKNPFSKVATVKRGSFY